MSLFKSKSSTEKERERPDYNGAVTALTVEELDAKHEGKRYVVTTNGLQYSRSVDYPTARATFERLVATTEAAVRIVDSEDYSRRLAEAALVAL